MSAPWELQGFNPQAGTSSSGTGQIKFFNPAAFQNQQVNQQNGGVVAGHGQEGGNEVPAVDEAANSAGGGQQDGAWNQAWDQWGQAGYNNHQQAAYAADNANQWYQPVQHDGQGDQEPQDQQQQQQNQNQQEQQMPHPESGGFDYNGQQQNYDWNQQWTSQQWDASNYNAANWQQHEQYQQGQWENHQGDQSQDFVGGSSFQSTGYANHDGGTSGSEAGNQSTVSAGSTHGVGTGQHDQSSHGNQETLGMQGDSFVGQASAEEQKPTLMTSDSFSKLPHVPSPFDDILGGGSVSGNVQPPAQNSLLGAPQFTPSHSRESSMGGNVQFIVGSTASSLSNSASQSPYPAQPSPSDSPKTGEGNQNNSQVSHPETVPEELPSPPVPQRVDQGEGVMASGQSQQHYYPQASTQYQQHQVGNATGYHQHPQHQQAQNQSDLAAHGNWHTHQQPSIPEQPPSIDAAAAAKNVRPPSVQSDSMSELSDSTGLRSSGGIASPQYQRSVSQQSVQSVDSLNNAFGILPSPRGRTTPQSQGARGSPHQVSSLQGTPPITGPVGAVGASDKAQFTPSPPMVGGVGGLPHQHMAGSPRNMSHHGNSPASQSSHTSSPLTQQGYGSGQPPIQPDVVPAQDGYFVPSPAGAASSDTTAVGNHGQLPHPQTSHAEGATGHQAGAVNDYSGGQLGDSFAPEASSSPMKTNTIVTPEEAQPATGRPSSLNVHIAPAANTNAAPVSPDHQLNIYASPIECHPDSPFQPPQKAASPAGSDITANYMAGAGPANVLNVGAGDSAQTQPMPDAANYSETGAVYHQDKTIPVTDAPPKNVHAPVPFMHDAAGQPANQKQISDQAAVVANAFQPNTGGHMAGTVTMAHHQRLTQERSKNMSPATTLWENPTPASPVHLLKAAPPPAHMEPPKNHIQPVEPPGNLDAQNVQPLNPQPHQGGVSSSNPPIPHSQMPQPAQVLQPQQLAAQAPAQTSQPNQQGMPAQQVHSPQQQQPGVPSPQQHPQQHGLPPPQQQPQQHGIPSPQQQPQQHGLPSPQLQPQQHGLPSQQQPQQHGLPSPQPQQHGLPAPQQQPQQHGLPSPQQQPQQHGLPSPQQEQHGLPSPQHQPQDVGTQPEMASSIQQGTGPYQHAGMQEQAHQPQGFTQPPKQTSPQQDSAQQQQHQQQYYQQQQAQQPQSVTQPPAQNSQQQVPSQQQHYQQQQGSGHQEAMPACQQSSAPQQDYRHPHVQSANNQQGPLMVDTSGHPQSQISVMNQQGNDANPPQGRNENRPPPQGPGDNVSVSKSESAPTGLDSRTDDYQRQDSRHSTASDTSMSSQSRDYERSRHYDDRSRDYSYSDRDRDPRYHNRSRDSRYDGDRYRDHDRYYSDRDNRYHDRYDQRPSSRGPVDQYGYPERPRSRQGHPDDPYYRPRSRQGHPSEDRYDRPRSRQGYPTKDEYDRPRSRQGGEPDRVSSRPSSRQSERPASRQGQDEDRQRDESGYRRDRRRDDYYRDYQRSRRDDYYGGYSSRDYDYYYGRDGRGYEDPYYQQYYQDSRFASGYLKEMQSYGQGYDYQQRDIDYDRRSQYSGSRGGTPGPENILTYGYGYSSDPYSDQRHSSSRGSTPGLADMGVYQQQGYDPRYGYPQQTGYEYDRRSHHTGSRSNTPGPENGADQFAREFHQGSRPSSRSSGYEQSPIAPQRDHSDYRQPYQDGSGYWQQEQSYQAPPPARMTPVKFSIPHLKVCFGPAGQMIKVLPNRPQDGQPARVEIEDVDADLKESKVAEELRLYPGPLVRAETHKNDVLLFCRKRARECQEDVYMTDRESAVLLWNFLELLIKQNGMIVGTDVADLLLEGHEPTTAEYSRLGLAIRPAVGTARSTPDAEDSIKANVTQDRSLINTSLSNDDVTDRFRHLVLHGRKKDALELAMKNNLWGHALFLGSKMDPKTHASIMTRFANTAMKMNDPLQTLYQLMSGRQPAAVTLMADDKWGDWRPHLAMMLANSSAKPELDRKSLITLGDTLATKGCLYASQFCYLMAQTGFESYSKKSAKLVLLGSSHTSNSSFMEFATNTAIQCTEVYEYAQSLGYPLFTLPNFHVYKFIYTTRLVDHGLTEEALHYCEVLANSVVQDPTHYPSMLVHQIYELGNRLKHFDPQRLHVSEDDLNDPKWLQDLRTIVHRFDEGSLQALSGTVTPMGGVTSTAASSEIGELMSGMVDHSQTYNQQAAYGQYEQQQAQQSYMGDQSQYGQGTWNQSGWQNSSQWGAQQWDQAGSYLDPNQQQADSTQTTTTQHQETNQETTQDPQLLQQQQQQQYQQYYQQQQQQQTGDQQWQGYEEQQQQQEQTAGDTTDYSNYQPFSNKKIPDDINLGASINSNATEATITSQTSASSDEVDSQSATDQAKPQTDYWAASTQQAPPKEVLRHTPIGDSLERTPATSTPKHIMFSSASSPDSASNGSCHPPLLSPLGTQSPVSKWSDGKMDTISSNDTKTASSLPPPPTFSASSSLPASTDENGVSSNNQDSSPVTLNKKSVKNVSKVLNQTSSPRSPFTKLAAHPEPLVSPANPTTPKEVFQFGVLPPELTKTRQTAAPLGAAQKMPPPPAPRQNKDQKPKDSAAQKDNKQTNDNKPKNNNQGGWFGGMIKKILPRGKNEMILPDDSKPAIVWDEAKQRWVDTNQTEEEQVRNDAPPPKDSELPAGAPPATPQGPAGGPPPPATPGSNRFSRQKTRGARGQYVDVFGGSATKTAPTNPNLFNVLPKSHTVPANLFIPSASEGTREVVQSTDNLEQEQQAPQQNGQQQQQQPQQQQIQQDEQQRPQQPQQMQFYNPAQYGQGVAPQSTQEDSQENLSRSSSTNELNREVQQFMTKNQEPPPASQAPPSGPAQPSFYNPSSFPSAAAPPAAVPGANRGGLRYGQRRAYPK